MLCNKLDITNQIKWFVQGFVVADWVKIKNLYDILKINAAQMASSCCVLNVKLRT